MPGLLRRKPLLDPKPAPVLDYADVAPKGGWGFRWWICALIFFATTINYIDRQIIAVLKPTLTTELKWSEIDFSNIVFWFQVSYAGGYLLAGRMIDRTGVRIGYALAVLLWSISAGAHAFVTTVVGFSAARFALGLAEGGNFPAAVKTISEWFPRKERAFATGVFNGGANIGALITPLLVPWITLHYGWRAAFFVTGALGFLWLIAWLGMYRSPRNHPRVSRGELAYIHSDPPDAVSHVSWLSLLRYRAVWAFVVGMFMSAPIWWFYLYWVPDFLVKQYGLNITTMGPPLVAIYLIADFGSIGGGWLSSFLIKGGFSVNAGRKIAMLVCALCVMPVFLATQHIGLWPTTLVIALAAAAHQGWAANLYTLVSDTMPRSTVSSIVGIGGMAGSIAGMFFSKFIGYVLEWAGNYFVLFAIASGAYLLALLIIQMLVPRLEPVEFTEPRGFEPKMG